MRELVATLPCLQAVGFNGAKSAQIGRSAMLNLFDNEKDAITLIKLKEIYELLESVTDDQLAAFGRQLADLLGDEGQKGSHVLGLPAERASVKASRPEGLGLSGDGVGCLALAGLGCNALAAERTLEPDGQAAHQRPEPLQQELP